MRQNEVIAKQLAARLKRLRQRARDLASEIEMLEGLLANVERQIITPSLKLRKNSLGKWSVQGQIRRELQEQNEPLKSQDIFKRICKNNSELKSSTFRSYLKRMVTAGLIEQEDRRGYYRLIRSVDEEPRASSLRSKPLKMM